MYQERSQEIESDYDHKLGKLYKSILSFGTYEFPTAPVPALDSETERIQSLNT